MDARLDRILAAARKVNASDVHVIAGVPPSFRVNGEILLAEADRLTRDATREIVASLLTDHQREVFEREKELCATVVDPHHGRFRLTLYFHGGNPELSIRLVTAEIPTAAQLGLPPVIDDLARKQHGLVLITGPTGVGKTTTLNYMVDLINRERRCKVVTIEDPVEFAHRPKKALIVQQELHTDVLSYARALINVLRQDPDVIVIGEMRDSDTITTALTAAETGHLVIATLHTPSVSQTMERIVASFPAGQQQQATLQLASTLEGVVAQDLIPKADHSGLVLATEVLVATAAVRNLIRENTLHLLYNQIQTGLNVGMHTMDRSLQDLYQKGVISYDAAMSRAREPNQLAKKFPKPEGITWG